MSISHSELLSLLHYDPETGIWTWLRRGKGRRPPGTKAGSIHKTLGYKYIGISFAGEKNKYLSHRLAWFYMTGQWPSHQIDHRDCNPKNDRWGNLREATQSQNNANVRVRRDSRSKLKGVQWDERRKKWRARIKIDVKTKHLGDFDCPAAAHFAYLIQATTRYGAFARAQ